jgi:hypothetical protein
MWNEVINKNIQIFYDKNPLQIKNRKNVSQDNEDCV